jgi:hypothetical protein
MSRYLIKHTMGCYVTWTYTIEAKNEDEARELFLGGAVDPEETEIGNNIDGVSERYEIEKDD